MAFRPAFSVSLESQVYVLIEDVDFQWVPGMAVSQKQKCISSMHSAILQVSPESEILEISSKSLNPLGVALSAFNLGFKHKQYALTVETAFQGSKCFEKGGPYREIYGMTSREAKKFFKEKDLGALVRFSFFGEEWPLQPRTIFYDWLYLNVLHRNSDLSSEILKFNTFTDIEFNPKKSLNCQAHAAALYVSLCRRGILESVLADKEHYKDLMAKSSKYERDFFQ
ncbi:hypothetical protein PDESU_03203 [Pontiella desulfatans]|uniref:Uncharacterized protein n=1 Tax=Pontiella desulfatans TaxID=2750659 RepID=A0A6C2U3N1_PONDE|nr:hypothetical protein [Pontiella desulfatans]VGO14638.1 hypothetical protein PDESU_03203 [Pontiella desulfatans]